MQHVRAVRLRVLYRFIHILVYMFLADSFKQQFLNSIFTSLNDGALATGALKCSLQPARCPPTQPSRAVTDRKQPYTAQLAH